METRLDVSAAVGEPATLAATVYPAATPDPGVLVCLPGGTYNRGYWHFEAPGHTGYNFAEYASQRGFSVVAVDPLGTGDSSRPARDIDLPDIAAALAAAIAAVPEVAGTARRPIVVAGWFHLPDVPAAVVEADHATTLSVVPRRFGAAAVPGITADEAALVDVPVFLGYGAVDVSPDPAAEAGFYRRSPEVTTMVLESSGHCHNMASTRRRLWDRLLAWAARP
ncbi:alpha/beta hydrolase [Mycobacterium talmoniae]|nr:MULTISPECIES: alpha/beta fold hydrolase [Mycobacterium]PQM48873.1 hypothetical protein C1Y40_00904 [Mycobacterium talmoniae]TDH50121.1 alpha/beta hydrolase [Mycobacterium eburneum]